MSTLYNYRFKFRDADGNYYKLRAEQITSATVHWRFKDSVDSFTETQDYNIEESGDAIWCRLPSGDLEIVFNIYVEPLQCITTSLQTLHFNEFTEDFIVTATPVPLYSKQGFSPRIIDGYWHQYSDELQAFMNTGVRAEATIITEGEVVDRPERGNMNPITSNAVYNIYNEQQTINNQVDNHFNNIETRIDGLESKPDVSVILNGVEHTQNIDGQIDLGTIDTTPNTRMLTSLTEIGGKYYPKGTEVDDNGRVYATDGFYYGACDTKAINNKSHLVLLTLRPGWYRINYQVYTTNVSGDIYVSKQGERGWSVIATSKQIADNFKLYYSSSVSSPDLVVRASSGYYIGVFNVQSNNNITISKLPMDIPTDRLVDIKYFITDYEQDTITIESNNYKMDDLTVTHFIVDVEGSVSVEVPDSGIGQANDFSFTATHDRTTIIFNDGTQTITSDEFNTGTRAELIYVSPDEYYWNYYEDASLQVKDVKVDGTTVVANRVAYIYSFTDGEVETIKQLFT